MTSGIYKIVNIKNDFYYLGSSLDIEQRWVIHKSSLTNNRHHSIYLQRAFNKYGIDNFTLVIQEQYDGYSKIELQQLEQQYLNEMNIGVGNYNVSKFAGGGDNISDHPNRDIIIEKIRQSNIKRYAEMTEEEWEQLSISNSGKNNGMYGKHRTEEEKEKIRARLDIFWETHNSYRKDKTFEELFGEEKAAELKSILSIAASQRIGDKNPFYGKTHTSESRAKISDKQKGKRNQSQCKPIIIDNKYYESLGLASESTNISIVTIRWRVLSQNKKFSNYRYATADEIKQNRQDKTK